MKSNLNENVSKSLREAYSYMSELRSRTSAENKNSRFTFTFLFTNLYNIICVLFKLVSNQTELTSGMCNKLFSSFLYSFLTPTFLNEQNPLILIMLKTVSYEKSNSEYECEKWIKWYKYRLFHFKKFRSQKTQLSKK